MAIGDTVYYNESTDETAPSWCLARVLLTDTVPAAGSVTAIENSAAYGAYPTPPGTGQVLLSYYAMAGLEAPSLQYAYAMEGTGVLQYSTTIPTGW